MRGIALPFIAAFAVAMLTLPACPPPAAVPCNDDNGCLRSERCIEGLCGVFVPVAADAGTVARDAGTGDDAGAHDAGTGDDAGADDDAGTDDGGGDVDDAGARDAGAADDAGEHGDDAGASDAGNDAGSGAPDAGTVNGGDAGPADAGTVGPADAGPVCGDGAINRFGEQCDDGNHDNGDGCEADCSLPFCGNAITDGAEQCDDGNGANDDGCDNNCTITGCGNRILNRNEQCDDGALANGDGCDSNCNREAPAQGGLHYEIFDGDFGSVNDFIGATNAVESGVLASVDISERQGTSGFGYVFEGFIFAPVFATYSFHVFSDDGAQLFVDNNLVVDGDGLHPVQDNGGDITIAAGWHAFRLAYFNGPSAGSLDVQWGSSFFAATPVQPSDFAVTP